MLGGSSSLGQHLIRRLGDEHEMFAVARSPESVAKIKAASASVEIVSAEQAAGIRFDRIFNLVVDYGRGGAPLAQLIHPNLFYPLALIEAVGADVVINVSTALPADYSHYAFSKSLLEQALTYLGERKNCRVLNVHLHNMYGPGVGPSELVGFVIAKMLDQECVEVSDCQNSRDFIFIDDVVEALARLSARCDHVSTARPVAVGSGAPTRLRDVVTLLGALTGSASEVRFGARAANPREPQVLAADISVLRQLGWSPRHSLREGLAATVSALAALRA